MGRPPIGKVAMTGAERTRLYRRRRGTDKPVTKRAGPDYGALVQELAEAKQELAQAKARIATLESALNKQGGRDTHKPVTQKPVNLDSDLARAKATIADLRKRLNYFKTRPEGKVDERTFTIIQSRTHPDRVSDPQQKARYQIAFQVLGELENALVDKDQLPLTRERMDTLRKKPPESKKRQPAASPKSARGLPKPLGSA